MKYQPNPYFFIIIDRQQYFDIFHDHFIHNLTLTLNANVRRGTKSCSDDWFNQNLTVSLSRNDDKRGTFIPWKQGKCLVWDVTCVNTIARSNIESSACHAGSASAIAEEKKRKKYSSLGYVYSFYPIAVEAFEPWDWDASNFASKVGRRFSVATFAKRLPLLSNTGKLCTFRAAFLGGLDDFLSMLRCTAHNGFVLLSSVCIL